MNDTFTTSILDLGLSQIYLSREKLDAIRKWFNPKEIHTYEPLPVRDFTGNGIYTLTDGHSRAFVAYQCGIEQIQVRIDTDEIVTCDLGQKLYRADIEWCSRFNLRSVADLEKRILDQAEYRFLWQERCTRLHNLVTGMENKPVPPEIVERLKHVEREGLFLYGAEQDFVRFYLEDRAGNLWSLAQGTLSLEYPVR